MRCPAARGGLEGGLLEGDGAGEEDVVFEVDVLVEVLLEFAEAVEVGMVGGAGALRGGEVAGESADFGQEAAGVVVLADHHGDGVGDGAEAFFGKGGAGGEGGFQFGDVGEEDGFFLHEVHGELFGEEREAAGEDGELGVGGAVAVDDLGGEQGEAGKLALHVGVMGCRDVGGEGGEGLGGPVDGVGQGAFFGGFEGGDDLVDFKLAGGAGFGEGLAASAAVVDAEVLEDSNGGRLVECDFADGLSGGGHGDSLGMRVGGVRRGRSDFGHSGRKKFGGGS